MNNVSELSVYAPAVIHLLLAGCVAFMCICRSRLMDESTHWRVIHQHNALFASAVLSMVPRADLGMLILLGGLALFLFLGSPRWNHPTAAFRTSLASGDN